MTTSCYDCAYKNCLNNNRVNKNISFFKFPVNDSKRTEEWQKNCGNINIALMDIDELKYKTICEVHFSSSYINKTLSENCYLKMPFLYDILRDVNKQKVRYLIFQFL